MVLPGASAASLWQGEKVRGEQYPRHLQRGGSGVLPLKETEAMEQAESLDDSQQVPDKEVTASGFCG